MADPITTFLSGLLGGGQQAPQAAPPPQQPSAPPQQSGLASFIGNPLVQGALAGYFSGISSPRTQGLGGAIGRGGLGALSAFDQAEQQRTQQPLNQAKLQNLQGQNQLQTAQVGLTGAKQQQLAGIQVANQHTAQVLRSMKSQLDPEQQKRAEILASTIENDTSKVYDPKEVATTLFLQPAQEKNLAASAARSGAETEAIPKKLAIDEAKAAEDAHYHTGELAARNRAIDKPAKSAKAATKESDSYQKAYQTAYKEAAANYIKTNTHVWGGPSTDEVDAYASKAAQAQADKLFPNGGKTTSAAVDSSTAGFIKNPDGTLTHPDDPGYVYVPSTD